jgi:hypothetical protein
MAAKKKSKKTTSSGEAHRVNMTFTPEEYEQLVAAGEKEMRPPTVMAKFLVMKALSGSAHPDRPGGQEG